jgi:hypothetical protein
MGSTTHGLLQGDWLWCEPRASAPECGGPTECGGTPECGEPSERRTRCEHGASTRCGSCAHSWIRTMDGRTFIRVTSDSVPTASRYRFSERPPVEPDPSGARTADTCTRGGHRGWVTGERQQATGPLSGSLHRTGESALHSSRAGRRSGGDKSFRESGLATTRKDFGNLEAASIHAGPRGAGSCGAGTCKAGSCKAGPRNAGSSSSGGSSTCKTRRGDINAGRISRAPAGFRQRRSTWRHGPTCHTSPIAQRCLA